MLNRRLLAVLIALIFALPAAPGVASAQDAAEEVRLTLDECLRIALENNLDLVSASRIPQIAEQDDRASARRPSTRRSAPARSYPTVDWDQSIVDDRPGHG